MGFYRVAAALLVMNLAISIAFTLTSAYTQQVTYSTDTSTTSTIDVNPSEIGSDPLGGLTKLYDILTNFVTMNYALWKQLGLDNVSLSYGDSGINLAAVISSLQGLVITLAIIEYVRGRY